MSPLREMQSLNNAIVCSLTNIPNFHSENQQLLASRLSSVMELLILKTETFILLNISRRNVLISSLIRGKSIVQKLWVEVLVIDFEFQANLLNNLWVWKDWSNAMNNKIGQSIICGKLFSVVNPSVSPFLRNW